MRPTRNLSNALRAFRYVLTIPIKLVFWFVQSVVFLAFVLSGLLLFTVSILLHPVRFFLFIFRKNDKN